MYDKIQLPPKKIGKNFTQKSPKFLQKCTFQPCQPSLGHIKGVILISLQNIFPQKIVKFPQKCNFSVFQHFQANFSSFHTIRGLFTNCLEHIVCHTGQDIQCCELIMILPGQNCHNGHNEDILFSILLPEIIQSLSKPIKTPPVLMLLRWGSGGQECPDKSFWWFQ